MMEYDDTNVVALPVITTLDIEPKRMLNAAMKSDLDSLVMIGFTQDGEFYFASNRGDAGTVMFLMETAKYKLLEICREMGIRE